MLFVNDIAKIVHGVSCEYLGIPNKNIGDAFLIVWKIPPHLLNKKYRIKHKKSFVINSLADFSLIAILKIILRLNSEESIIKYRNDQQIIEHNEKVSSSKK